MNPMWTIGYFAVIIILFYLVLFLPESRRKKKYNGMIQSLKVNDEIITKGGVVGKIVNVYDEYIILQTGPDKVKIKLAKVGIMNAINTKEEIK